MLCRRSRALAASWPAVSTKRLIWLSGAPAVSATALEALAGSMTRMMTTTTTTIRKPVALSSAKWTRVNNSSQLKWPFNLLALVAALSLLTLVGRDSYTSGQVRAEIAAKSDSGQPVNQQADNEPHPSSMVDTKYWVSSTQFNEPRNWLDNKKPCTLIEPIVISEQEVIISMGGDAQNSLGGALESNIRDLILAQDGILLLDSDNAGQSRTDDKMFMQQLNESGDCFDSSALSTTDFTELGAGGDAQMFKFEPYSDDMSWFNPANWRSKLYANAEIAHLVPESNQIPCSEDMVVFGHSQSVALGDTTEPSGDGGGSGQPTTFKVNFRPSEQYEGPANLVSLASLRVSRLTIGDKSYNQTDFDRLIDLYSDNLFDFADNKSVFNRPLVAGGDSSANDFQLDRQNNILTIDESSTQLGAHELCQDEAGCQCGNDRPDLLRIICSFNYEPDSSQLPCYDPIQAPGYCKKICATSILILMDPTKFSEHYIFSILEYLDKLGPTADSSSVDSSSQSSSSSSSSLSQPENYYTSNIFVGARRIDYNKYDITLHLMAKDDADYISAIGQDVEYANVIKEHLEKAATKSFYGIKGVAIKSSVRWRRNNRRSAFIISFIVMVSISTFLFHYDKYPGVALLTSASSMINYQFGNKVMRTTKSGLSDNKRLPSPSYITEPKILDEIVSISDLPVVSDIIKDDPRRQANNVDLVELDTQSISGSTHNLIDPVAD